MIAVGNNRAKKLYIGASPVQKIYVGMGKIFPDIVLTAVPETYTFAYQMNKAQEFVVSTANFTVASKPGWLTTTVSGVKLTAKTNSEHNTSNTARNGNIVVASSEDSSVTLTIAVSQNGNVYISNTTTEETWSSGYHCDGCDDVENYHWRYKYTWTDGSVTYSSEYSDERRDTNWQSCVEAVGKTCSESTGSWGSWSKVYGTPQSSCSGSTEIITTPWTQERQRTITTDCTWQCTGESAPGGSSTTETESDSGTDTQNVANSSNCGPAIDYTETCYEYYFLRCAGTKAYYNERMTVIIYYSDGSSERTVDIESTVTSYNDVDCGGLELTSYVDDCSRD